MCWKIGTPLMEDAMAVVSESGDILSPKYAPDIMAPAVTASEKPWTRPIPRRATPIVAIVVHELPVIRETNAQMTVALTRNSFGEIAFTP